MTLSERLAELVRACFTALWIQSHEHADALAEITQLCRTQKWRLVTWDIDQGLSLQAGGSSRVETGTNDPLAAIRALNALGSQDSAALLVLGNFHRFLQSGEIIQALARQAVTGKTNRTFVVVLSPVVSIPVELEKLFVVVEHELPGRSQLEEIARGIGTEQGEVPEGPELQTLLDAAAGLTRFESESAFSLSLVRHGRIRPETVWELKTATLKKSGLLSLHRGGEDFSQLGGLTALKAFSRRLLLQPSRGNPLKRPRGLLLLSPPGCGKSAFCKCLGQETGRPVLMLDVGTLMGSLVGQTEERTRQVLKIADAMAPAVLMIDEVEKAFAGVSGSGQTDSGVGARMFGTFLAWLNDHASDVFVVCTANDVSRLPPEFARAERFDAVFFLDLPQRAEKDAIWNLYLTQFELSRDQRIPVDDGWTGAEIRACCRLAALLDVPLLQAAQNVVPVSATAAESVERVRTWASGRCLSAEKPGLYCRDKDQEGPRRRVSRDASNN